MFVLSRLGSLLDKGRTEIIALAELDAHHLSSCDPVYEGEAKQLGFLERFNLIEVLTILRPE